MKKNLNKRNIVFLFLSGIIFLSSYSFYNNENIEKYYENINEADYLIVKKEYNKALTLFDKAFEYKKIPFARDLYNAGMCALLLNDEKAFNYFEKLAQKGILLESLPTKELITLNKEKYDAFEVKYTEQRKKALITKNIKLKNEIVKMLEHDQELAREKDFDKTKRPKYYQALFQHSKRISKIIEDFGFPNEDIIGIDKPHEETKLYFILLHHFQAIQIEYYFQNHDSLSGYSKKDFGIDSLKFSSLNLLSSLKNEVVKGRLSRTMFAELEEIISQSKYGLLLNILVDKKVAKIVYNMNEIPAIDSARKQIYLEPYIEYIERTDSMKINFKDRESYMKSRLKKEPFISGLRGHSFAMFFTDSIQGANYILELQSKYPNMILKN